MNYQDKRTENEKSSLYRRIEKAEQDGNQVLVNQLNAELETLSE